MSRIKIGNATVHINYNDDNTYSGRIVVKRGVSWEFDDLRPAAVGFGPGVAYDSRKALREMAKSACAFGGYYTTLNRSDETPDWAPPPDVADAIDDATALYINS